MRWIVASLLFFNAVFLVWNWLEYSHGKNLEKLNMEAHADNLAMPGARLVLLKERVVVEASENANDNVLQNAIPALQQSADSADQNSQAEINTATVCMLLGPVADKDKGEGLVNRLKALQIVAEYSYVNVTGDPDYWVYLGGFPNREMAVAKLKELQDKKIDSFIIPQGDLANGISLGVFDKQENAEIRRQEMEQMGYETKVYVNTKSYMESWVVVRPEEAAKLSAELFDRLKEESPLLDMRKEECTKVARTVDIQ